MYYFNTSEKDCTHINRNNETKEKKTHPVDKKLMTNNEVYALKVILKVYISL